MLVPGWALMAAVAVGTLAIGLLCLIIRRAMTELFFWRGAYKCTNDRAYELLRALDQPATPSGDSATAERDLRRVRSRGGAAPAQAEGIPEVPKSLVQKYHDSVHLVEESAARLRIDWVTDADREFWLTEYQAPPFRLEAGGPGAGSLRGRTVV